MYRVQNSFLKERPAHGRLAGYEAPGIRVLLIGSERSFLASGGSNDDNEHTGEDDLF